VRGGFDCRPFVLAGAEVTGMDICSDLGTACPHPNARYLQGSIEGCDLPSNHFDVVFCLATMEHVSDIEAGFSEMFRLARPRGVIYSVAAPLWNSRHGHHVRAFRPFPWIHLRLPSEQALMVLQQHNITPESIDLTLINYLARLHNVTPAKINLQHVMDFVMISDYFNRARAQRYLAACRRLPVTNVLRNDLWIDGEEDLTPRLMAELTAKGFTREDLLSTSHTFVAQK